MKAFHLFKKCDNLELIFVMPFICHLWTRTHEHIHMHGQSMDDQHWNTIIQEALDSSLKIKCFMTTYQGCGKQNLCLSKDWIKSSQNSLNHKTDFQGNHKHLIILIQTDIRILYFFPINFLLKKNKLFFYVLGYVQILETFLTNCLIKYRLILGNN